MWLEGRGDMAKDEYQSRTTPRLVVPAWFANDEQRCLYECPDGRRCVLDTRRPHTLHICEAWDCACHERARYECNRRANATIDIGMET